jgi:peptidoglycan-associated lipoprotein
MRNRTLAVMSLLLMLGVLGACKKPPVTTPQPAPQEPARPTPTPAPEPPIKEVPPPDFPKEPPVEKTDQTADVINQSGVLKTVHFGYDQFDIREEDRPILQANAAWLKSNAKWKVRIEGNCDERGTTKYNLALGERRANAVREYLVSLGVPAPRIRIVSYGEEHPLDPGHNETAWAANRRGEFYVEP